VSEASTDVVIIGGGLAGLTAAIHLAREGARVVVVETREYPQHKVCGEYVSNEILPYFASLGIPVRTWQPKQVQRFRLHAPSGRWVESRLPLGGFGLRRYTLDYNLYRIAQELGVEFALRTTVRDVELREGRHLLHSTEGSRWQASAVLGSFGKRSELDRLLGRGFMRRPATHVGLKFYLRAAFPSDLVALYGLDAGYAGAVQVEDGSVDIACLTTEAQLQANGGLDGFEERVLQRHPALGALLRSGTRLQAKPFTISNVSFCPKQAVVEHILMVGDAAGMIFPLCGNGMAMGVHGAKLAAEAVLDFLGGRLDRLAMEERFRSSWRREFGRRLFWGRRLQPLVDRGGLSELAVGALRHLPALLPPIIRRTHGAALG
jgi:flavin-dependent dehydrogenase